MLRIICEIITEPIKRLAEDLKCSPEFACNLVSTWKSKTGETRYPTIEESQNLLKSEKNIIDEIYTAIPFYEDGNGNIGNAGEFNPKLSLSNLNKEGKIILRRLPNENPLDYFFNYIQGNLDNSTSKQKKKVFEQLEKEGYTIDKLRELIDNPTDAYRFLLWHEMSHLQNQDALVYWSNEKGKNPNLDTMTPDEKESVKDYLSQDKIDIEVRATISAFKKMLSYRKANPKKDVNQVQQDTSDKTVTQQQIEQQRVYVTPSIGSEILNIDLNNPIAKVAREFNAIERNDRAIMMARQFTAIVDGYISTELSNINSQIYAEQSKENPNTELLSKLAEDRRLITDPVLGRRQAIQRMTFESIFEQMKDEYNEIISLSEEELADLYGENAYHVKEAYKKIIDNFDILIDDACVYIESAENLRIVTNKHDYHNGNDTEKVTGATVTNSSTDEELNEETNNDDEEGNRADGNGGWSYKIRFVDPLRTLSKDIKRLLSNIQRLDYKGDLEYDDLGNPRYLNEEVAHSLLLNELSSMISADDFSIEENGIYKLYALEKIAIKYPWVKQIISEIQDNPKLISSFYSNFRKDYINYWMQRNGKSFPLNAPVALESTMNRLIRNYEQGIQLTEDSIYSVGNQISLDNVNKGIIIINDVLNLEQEYEKSDSAEVIEKVSKVAKMLGLELNELMITNMLNNPETFNDVFNAARVMSSLLKRVEEMPEGSHLITYFNQEYKTIADYIGDVAELDNIQSFRQGNKTYPSYSAPNYVDTMFKSLKRDDIRDQYINRQFKRFSWFYDNKNQTWNNEWLNLIENDENVRNAFDVRELNNINGKEYEKWTPDMIKPAFILEYFSSGIDEKSPHQYAWYNMPIFSDSPIVKFIKFVRYRTDSNGTFKDKLIPLFRKVVKQELERIKLVQKRRNLNVSTITNFDTNGDKFHFFPELNNYQVDNVPFLEAITRAERISDIDAIIDTTIKEIMLGNFNKFLWTNLDRNDFGEQLLQAKVLTKDPSKDKYEEYNEVLEEYFWNQAFATTQIIQLTTTDLAYYKNDVDFQKRFKEVYAAGIKLNTNHPNGRKIERTIYISDQIITSRTYNDLKRILLDAQKEGKLQSYDVDAILNTFRNVNVADAQAYRSLGSLKAVLEMMGAWTPEMQATFDKFDSKTGEKKNWNMGDFNTIWQTIKPFVFTQIEKSDGNGGLLKVPHQNKNSECLLLTMYNLLAQKVSPKMRAINKFMEDKNNPIDVIQFESAVKVGKEGCIDLTYSPTKFNKYLKANNLGDISFKEFKKSLDAKLDLGRISQEEYNDIMDSFELSYEETLEILNEYSKLKDGTFNPDVVHEIPYDDYVIQQPTPEHLFDAIAVFGSQFRNLIVSDISDAEGFTINVNGKDYTKKELLNLYQSLIVENLLQDWVGIKDRFTDIKSLQAALMDQVKSNSKYGRDMVDALQLIEIINPITNKKELVFNIPLHNPSTTNKLQELLNSMFKNSITKQSIKGGNCILVSSFGYTQELEIKYNEDGSIKYLECYLPAYSKKFYEPFIKEDGTLDINKMPKELRHLIGYRIPTENKYSMAPLYIKGFLPQQNGSAIMLPAEITAISGADYDVDKLFLMIPEFTIQRYDKGKARRDFALINSKFKELLAVFKEGDINEETLSIDTNDFNEWFAANKDKYLLDEPIIRKVKYDAKLPASKQSRAARNNMLIDISRSILTNKDTAFKICNPGNFDKLKKASYISIISQDYNLATRFLAHKGIEFGDRKTALSKLNTLLRQSSLKELADFVQKYSVERTQLSIDTFIYNHTQNMTGAALIGMYANNTTMQSKYQNTSLGIKEDFVFYINDKKIHSLHDIYNEENELISLNCAQASAASVDNVKDPVLANLMQNTATANIAGFMLRAGMTIEEVGLLFTQPIIKNVIESTGTLKKFLYKQIQVLEANYKSLGGSTIEFDPKLYNPTSEQLLDNILQHTFRDDMSDIEMLNYLRNNIMSAKLMLHIYELAEVLSDLTKISRADSPNGAIDISIAGAKVQTNNVEMYQRRGKLKSFPLSGVQDAHKNDIVNPDMSIDKLREVFMSRPMPMLQAFYSLGIEFGTKLISKYIDLITPTTDALIERIANISSDGEVFKDTIEMMYRDLMSYYLSSTSLFGNDSKDTFDAKRDYYLHKFPSVFEEKKLANPDIASLGIISKIQNKNGELVLNKSGRLTPLVKESLMRDLDMLLYMNNPEAQKLAVDLFLYSFYKEGFKFGSNNYSSFFSSVFLNAFPDYIKALRNIKESLNRPEFIEKFFEQFIVMHSNIAIGKSIKIITNTFNDGQIINVEARRVVNPLNDFKPYEYINIVYDMGVTVLYKLQATGSTECAYTRIDTPKSEYKFNANMNVEEIVKNINEFTKQSIPQQNTATSQTIETSQEALDDSLFEDNFPFDNMDYDYFESMQSGIAELESYPLEEGNNQLDQPLC